ncbi:MAG: hypothetical protein JWN86_3210 [Planctomycetota bacterium]|nr:hypothetical protein [Planctomycetota bacterium]
MEWQQWANQLLARRYGPAEYQKVPDNDRRDAGIEGFTLTDGHAYQAYGCDKPVGTAARYEKQRNKITQDLNKYVNNKDILTKLFGVTRITRWVLFVPFFDSRELVAHAAKKTQEIIDKKLSYTHATFRVAISDEDDFSVERDNLLNAGCATLDVGVSPATNQQVQDWITTNDSLVATLDQKIAKLPTIDSEDKRVLFREKLLKYYIEGQEAWEYLRKYPSTYERLFDAKMRREKFLETSCMLHSGSNADLLRQSLAEFMETIREETKSVSKLTAESLAWEAVADWMIRCPLNFPGGAH